MKKNAADGLSYRGYCRRTFLIKQAKAKAGATNKIDNRQLLQLQIGLNFLNRRTGKLILISDANGVYRFKKV
jgi:hypothetical protein